MPAVSRFPTSSGCRTSAACSGIATRFAPGWPRSSRTRSTACGRCRTNGESACAALRSPPASARSRLRSKREGSIREPCSRRDGLRAAVARCLSLRSGGGHALVRSRRARGARLQGRRARGSGDAQDLVREVVAAGRDPATTQLGDIAEPPIFTLDADQDLEVAFRELEERDLERVPVIESGRLVGILSRAVVQRRLAEDEPPAEETA